MLHFVHAPSMCIPHTAVFFHPVSFMRQYISIQPTRTVSRIQTTPSFPAKEYGLTTAGDWTEAA